MNKYYVYIITTVVCVLLQVAIAPNIAIAGCTPNFLLIPLIVVAMYSGPTVGSIFGFVIGLFGDFAGDSTIGAMALSFTIIGVGVGLFASASDSRHPLVMCVVVICVALFHELFYGLCIILTSAADASFAAALVRLILPEALYSLIFGCIALATICLVVQEDRPTDDQVGNLTMPKLK